MPPTSLMACFLADPIHSQALSEHSTAELLLRQARSANLLSRVAYISRAENCISLLPERMQRHLANAERVCAANHRSVRWEVRQILSALSSEEIPVCLLKGAAYVLGETLSSRGRVFSDVDILVPKQDLNKAEKLLVANGWLSTKIDAYDQRYYREWMHELPPLQHMKRGTTLDVHHTIVPPTAGLNLDIDLIWADVQEVPGCKGLFVPAPIDMILHSAVHLFHDGEFDSGLRDLSDLDLLIKQFSSEEGFWEQLLKRGKELDLGRPLFYALRYCTEVLNTAVPDVVLSASAVHGPGAAKMIMMDALFLRALAPDHESCAGPWTGLARWLLFVRSHWLRMPLSMLLWHLSRKSLKRWQSGQQLQKA